VYKGCFRFCDVAFKQINISLYSEKQLTYLLNELTCMKKLRHPNVVLLLGISIDDMENLIIILEYFEQLTMDQFVKKYKGQIPISTKCEILFDIGKFLTLKKL
jgi:serine/threonine protein kinase